MPLSQPRAIFGVHSVSPYSRTDHSFFGILKVLRGSSLSIEGEAVELKGGSNKFAWAVEDGEMNAEMQLRFAEYPDFVFQLFLGKAPTTNTAESAGNISAANFRGTSVISGTTGIATVVVIPTTGAANLKMGTYVIRAASASTVDVYHSSDIDHGRGTSGAFIDDSLKINQSPLSITTGANTDLAAFGLRLTGGSGTIGLVTGDTARVVVRPVNAGSTSVVIGSAANQSFPEFGALVYAQKRGSQEMVEIDCYRCKAAGMPIGLEMNAYSEAEVTVKVFYDSARDGVFEFKNVRF